MKKTYIQPSFQILVLNCRDIITDSGNQPARLRWAEGDASTEYEVL